MQPKILNKNTAALCNQSKYVFYRVLNFKILIKSRVYGFLSDVCQ